MMSYNPTAPKRPVNLSLNEDLVRKVREVAGNLSERVEILLAGFLEAEQQKRAEADTALAEALAGWNAFADEHGSLADEHSTL